MEKLLAEIMGLWLRIFSISELHMLWNHVEGDLTAHELYKSLSPAETWLRFTSGVQFQSSTSFLRFLIFRPLAPVIGVSEFDIIFEIPNFPFTDSTELFLPYRFFSAKLDILSLHAPASGHLVISVTRTRTGKFSCDEKYFARKCWVRGRKMLIFIF